MAHQQGYIFKKGDSWFLRYRTDVVQNGAKVRKQKCVFLAKYSDQYRCESDLDDLVAEKLAGVRAADRCGDSCTPFVSYVADVWLPMIKATRKASTAAAYESYFKAYVRPRVEGLALRDFTVAIVSRLLADAASAHDLNVKTAEKIRSVLSGIFTFAIGTGAYPARSSADNPCSRALIPSAAAKQKPTHCASVEAVKAILGLLQADGLELERAAVALAAYTGVRPGELRGLRWEDWNRTEDQIQVSRSVWRAVEGEPKTPQSRRFVAVNPELRSILLALWNSRSCPISGYILARADGGRVNLDNMAKRTIIPALSRCAICKQASAAKHEGHTFERDETVPQWHGFYSLRRFHATQVREQSGSSDTASKALGNSKEVADRHYIKPSKVLPDVRRAVNAMPSLIQ